MYDMIGENASIFFLPKLHIINTFFDSNTMFLLTLRTTCIAISISTPHLYKFVNFSSKGLHGVIIIADYIIVQTYWRKD